MANIVIKPGQRWLWENTKHNNSYVNGSYICEVLKDIGNDCATVEIVQVIVPVTTSDRYYVGCGKYNALLFHQCFTLLQGQDKSL